MNKTKNKIDGILIVPCEYALRKLPRTYSEGVLHGVCVGVQRIFGVELGTFSLIVIRNKIGEM